jgi:hypothetical protein
LGGVESIDLYVSIYVAAHGSSGRLPLACSDRAIPPKGTPDCEGTFLLDGKTQKQEKNRLAAEKLDAERED